MNEPQFPATLVIALVAIIVLGADIAVRLILLPHQREKFILSVMDHLMEPSPAPNARDAIHSEGPGFATVQECLLRHFENSTASRLILSTLGNSAGLGQKELAATINNSFAKGGKPPLPLAAARRVEMLLQNAGLVGVEGGVLRVTRMGQELNRLLANRERGIYKHTPQPRPEGI